jgi:hypothetical protein
MIGGATRRNTVAHGAAADLTKAEIDENQTAAASAADGVRGDATADRFLRTCTGYDFVLQMTLRSRADRLRADPEYQVNLKAKLEITQLNEKMDFLTEEILARVPRRERPARVPTLQ